MNILAAAIGAAIVKGAGRSPSSACHLIKLFTRQRLEAGMDAHLSKHVDIDTLVELLAKREAVDRADASREA